MLRRHVRHFSLELAGDCQARPVLSFGYPEVEELGHACGGQEQVVWRNIAVNEVGGLSLLIEQLVHMVETKARIADGPHHDLQRQSEAGLPDAQGKVAQRQPLQKLHRDEVFGQTLGSLGGLDAQFDDFNDVLVLERSKQAGLAHEHLNLVVDAVFRLPGGHFDEARPNAFQRHLPAEA